MERYAVGYTPQTARVLRPIGLALDGHVIYGPYSNSGSLWSPCDVDICNGRLFYDSTGVFENAHYGYVATIFYPYLVSCFGPGSPNYGMKVGCSTNARYCASNAFMLHFSQAMSLLILVTVLIFA